MPPLAHNRQHAVECGSLAAVSTKKAADAALASAIRSSCDGEDDGILGYGEFVIHCCCVYHQCTSRFGVS